MKKEKENLIIIEGREYTKEYIFNVYEQSMSCIANNRYRKMNTAVFSVDDYINEALTALWITINTRLNSVIEFWGQVTICVNNWVNDALSQLDMQAMNSIQLSRSTYKRFQKVKGVIINRKSTALKEKGIDTFNMSKDYLLNYPVEEVDDDLNYIILETLNSKNSSMHITGGAKKSIEGFKAFIEAYKTQVSLDVKIHKIQKMKPGESIQDITLLQRTTINYHEIDEKKRCREEMLKYCEMLYIDLEDIEAIARGYHNEHLRKVAEKIRNSEYSSIIYENLTRMCEIERRTEVLI